MQRVRTQSPNARKKAHKMADQSLFGRLVNGHGKLLALLMAVVMIAAACGGSDDAVTDSASDAVAELSLIHI